MGKSKDKFFVSEEFRRNDLSSIKSSINATVHYTGDKSSRIYDNIHYPNSFAKKVFEQHTDIDYIEFKDVSNGKTWIEKI